MWGAIVGDVVGSIYEHTDIKGFNLPLLSKASHPTDETVLLAATRYALDHNNDFQHAYRNHARRYPNAGYGEYFSIWIQDEYAENYASHGNGAASRVLPVALQATSQSEAMTLAKESAQCSHGSEEGIQGAQAVAVTAYLIKSGESVERIKEIISYSFYPLYYDLEELHENYSFETGAESTVPVALWIALNSKSFEDCLRKGLYIGGDTDTIMSIACGIAELIHKDIPEDLLNNVKAIVAKKMPDIYQYLEDTLEV